MSQSQHGLLNQQSNYLLLQHYGPTKFQQKAFTFLRSYLKKSTIEIKPKKKEEKKVKKSAAHLFCTKMNYQYIIMLILKSANAKQFNDNETRNQE